MARSPQSWYNFLIEEKNNQTTLIGLQPNIDSSQTLLKDLTTTSRVALWRLLFWVVAVCAYALDLVFEMAIANIEEVSKQSRYGTLKWYSLKALQFQFGFSLVWNNNEYVYEVLDASAQIIKKAAAHENGNVVNVKVAKMANNKPAPLSAIELSSFETYLKTIKPAGVKVQVISDQADDLRLYLKVNYDALLMDSTGQLLSSAGSYPVQNAINNYLNGLNDTFDGTLELMTLIDYIQAAAGVVSAYVINASARYGTLPFVSFTERYQSNAGHIAIDSSTLLSSTITYNAAHV